jgi:hypothetical protein
MGTDSRNTARAMLPSVKSCGPPTTASFSDPHHERDTPGEDAPASSSDDSNDSLDCIALLHLGRTGEVRANKKGLSGEHPERPWRRMISDRF